MISRPSIPLPLLALAMLAAAAPGAAFGATATLAVGIAFEQSARLGHRAGAVSVGSGRRQVINVLSAGGPPRDGAATLRVICSTSTFGRDCGPGVLHGALAGTIRLADEAGAFDIEVVYQ